MLVFLLKKCSYLKKNELVCKIGHTDKVHNKGCYRGCAVGRPAEYVVSEVEGELGRRLGLRPEENMQEHTFGKLSQFTFFVLAKCCELHVLRSCRCRRAILIAGGEGLHPIPSGTVNGILQCGLGGQSFPMGKKKTF